MRKSADIRNNSNDLLKEYSEEIDMLQNIYPDKIEINEHEDGSCTIIMLIEPQDGCKNLRNKLSERLTLLFRSEYKEKRESPKISISQARGLSEETIAEMLEELRQFVTENEGTCILYQTIALAEELIAKYELPTIECPICLEKFVQENFMRTECYHFFHFQCICDWFVNFTNTEEAQEEGRGVCFCPICKAAIDIKTLEEECGSALLLAQENFKQTK